MKKAVTTMMVMSVTNAVKKAVTNIAVQKRALSTALSRTSMLSSTAVPAPALAIPAMILTRSMRNKTN